MMQPQVADAMSRSSEDFLRFVWPAFGGRFGRIIPVESVAAAAFAKELDTRAGIDNWVIRRDPCGLMLGLASRVQWTDRSYDTFTVRVVSRSGRPTEYHKRRQELQTPGAITPHYFTQGYVSRDRTRLVAAAITCMRDVIAAVDQDKGRLMKPNRDGTRGYAVKWSTLQEMHAPLECVYARSVEQEAS